MRDVTQYDIVAAALLLVFGYSGYRRGLLGFVLHLTGGVLAFGLAAALAPLFAPQIARSVRLPAIIVQPAAIVVLTAALRVLFGFAVRELATALQAMAHAIAPLALLDRLLGIIPGLALGALVVLAVTFAALALPLGQTTREVAAESWVARNVVTRPEDALTTLQRLWNALVMAPPRLSLAPLAVGVGGLWVGAFAARRARRAHAVGAAQEASTRAVIRRPAAQEIADPLAFPRTVLGILLATAMMAALLLVGHMQ